MKIQSSMSKKKLFLIKCFEDDCFYEQFVIKKKSILKTSSEEVKLIFMFLIEINTLK